MEFNKTKLKDVMLIKQNVFTDHRGTFIKIFHDEMFNQSGLRVDFKESYFSESKKNVIRGMHFQTPPKDHAKLATIFSGRVLDVILDLRTNSPTYGQYEAFELSRDGHTSVFIPAGCAHGFQSLEDNSIVFYMTTSVYSVEHDSGVRYDSFGFNWPCTNPITNTRDLNFPTLKDFKSPF